MRLPLSHPKPDSRLLSERRLERKHLAGRPIRSYGSCNNQHEANSKVLTRNGGRALQDFCKGQSNGHRTRRSNEARMSSGYRRLTSRSVTLPPEEWYQRLRIPGVTRRSSPHSNVVHTTKYTILTFIPKNLWEQFHRWANIFFLFIVILNFIPAVQAIAVAVAPIPLAFILLVTAVKDIFEDYNRYRSDNEVNRRVCRVYDRLVASGLFYLSRTMCIYVLLHNKHIPRCLVRCLIRCLQLNENINLMNHQEEIWLTRTTHTALDSSDQGEVTSIDRKTVDSGPAIRYLNDLCTGVWSISTPSSYNMHWFNCLWPS